MASGIAEMWWCIDPEERQIGAWNKANVDELLYSLALWPMTSRRGLRYIWTPVHYEYLYRTTVEC